MPLLDPIDEVRVGMVGDVAQSMPNRIVSEESRMDSKWLDDFGSPGSPKYRPKSRLAARE